VGSVVVKGNRNEVGVGEFEIGHIGTIDLKLELIVVVEDRQTTSVGGNQIGTSGCQVLHGVVEVEFLHLGTR